MAEPGDVEDDLFADLYDADESTNRQTSAVEPPKVLDSNVSYTPAQPTNIPTAQPAESFRTDTDHAHAADPYSFSYEGHERNGAGSYDAHTSHNDISAPAAESEPQGTGIKEDG
ncbi:uncharacterized protein ACLA_068240 [Aspergillus clavatus NRRL 1]|uniref:Uncharacterized protein n=1 Tax=Aspergillus clavatus (strain ATCC 1007 / CBS 513.65 / DSM 816 / NCTC 3887 / NRRL 1 / QM 1276 / 107) TaxID=344612 RepID=A1C5X6_ASPCL|nr:uncharacterized protein ACLA_068240 [Aspergillus clavatus NRRL 1]EAW13797.1 hypothetical protein ACLA_068240 [Aspergillus clavatus NRRL 1]